jgi:hypothetical protein
MLTREEMLQKIESAGYSVYGGRDSMCNEPAPLVVNAKDAQGRVTRVSVETEGIQGEVEALQQLAKTLGVPLDDGA